MRYAEVIGDPIAQSKSPIIHNHWLEQLNLTGEYRRTRVPKGTLAHFLAERRADPDWRGCNITIPHKEEAAALVDQLDARAQAIGAVNCVVPCAGGLAGTNTDVDGIAAALDSTALEGERVAIIGGGGAARAALAYLGDRNVAEIVLFVRDPMRAEPLRAMMSPASLQIAALSKADSLLGGTAAIVNASPLGMAGFPAMPDDLVAAIARHCDGGTVFDMVYDPLETRFLTVGREAGARTIGGLTMLVGQAARAFELFFGVRAPAPDRKLCDLLATEKRVSP